MLLPIWPHRPDTPEEAEQRRARLESSRAVIARQDARDAAEADAGNTKYPWMGDILAEVRADIKRRASNDP